MKFAGKSLERLYMPYVARWKRRFMRKYILHPDEYFAGKNILLVGAADSALEELRDVDLDHFDIIVRTNRAIEVPLEIDGKTLFRNEVLFHNLQQDGARSAGVITPEKLMKNETRLIVYPYGPLDRLKVALKNIRSMKGKTDIRMVNPRMISELKSMIGRKSPTTGFVAINVLAHSNCRALHIVGFTFFETGFLPGYNPATKTAEDAKNWAYSVGWHSPNKEKDIVRKLMKSKHVRTKITLGAITEKSISNHYAS